MEQDCSKCKNINTSECDECSNLWENTECCCHINPPCSFCENNHFEEKEKIEYASAQVEDEKQRERELEDLPE